MKVLELARLSNFLSIGKSPVATIGILYLMIQPRVKNKEGKILFNGGEPKAIVNAPRGGFMTPTKDIYGFAQRVTTQLKTNILKI